MRPDQVIQLAEAAQSSHSYGAVIDAVEALFTLDALDAAFRPPPEVVDLTCPSPSQPSPAPAAGQPSTSAQPQHPQHPQHSQQQRTLAAAAAAAAAPEHLAACGDLYLDFERVDQLYTALVALKDRGVVGCLMSGGRRLCGQLSNQAGRGGPPGHGTAGAAGLFAVRQLAVQLVNPLLEEVEHHDTALRLFQLINGLPEEHRKMLSTSFLHYPLTLFTRVLVLLQQFITLSLYNDEDMVGRRVVEAVQVLDLLYKANMAGQVVPAASFYNDAVCGEDFDVRADFLRYKQGRSFCFCNYPFMYDPATKAEILHMEHYNEQMNQVHDSFIHMLLQGRPLSLFFSLSVRRGEHMVRDTMVQLNRAQNDDSLKKPMKVRFVGEQGVDEGGVKKEFFQLLVRELFNPDYGMFVFDSDTRLYWFQASHMEGENLDADYEAVGVLIGLAIYNEVILDFTFPMVLYKKLLGRSVGLDDLREMEPAVWSSFKSLLAMPGEEVEALDLTFQVETEGLFGMRSKDDLLPGGEDIRVTSSNRAEYVAQYVKFLLERRVERQFTHFQKGFLRMCSPQLLSHFFRPEELESLICGGRQLDIEQLEAHCVYDDGYDKNHQVIRWFWQAVRGLTPEQHKRLLSFVTGTDRVPIKGLAHLRPPLVISRSGPHTDRLPTAHTCFNHLLLPQYRDEACLRQRLLLAIENAEGFGLI